MPKKGRRGWLALIAVTVLATACQSAGDSADGTKATTSSPSPDQSGTTQPTPVDREVDLGPGTFDLLDPRTGLTELASYKQTLVISFEGTRNGQPYQWSQTYTFVHAQQPLVTMSTVESSGDAVAVDPVVVAESSGVLYQSYRDGTCTGDPIDPATSVVAQQEPAGRLPGLLGAGEAGPDSVNGVPALHYTYDERALVESGRAETTGDMWVAIDGGHVLKSMRTTTSDAAYFGDEVEGTITWAYDLTEIDQVRQIILPPGCQIDAPGMPDAENLQVLPTWLGFETPSTVAAVTAFYQEQLPGRGWTRTGDPLIADGTEITVYAKGNETLNVMAIAGETATRVDILLGALTG